MLSSIQLDDAAFMLSSSTPSLLELGSPADTPLSFCEAHAQQDMDLWCSSSSSPIPVNAVMPWWQHQPSPSEDDVEGTSNETMLPSPFDAEHHFTSILKHDALFNILEVDENEVDDNEVDDSINFSSTDDALSSVVEEEKSGETFTNFDERAWATSTSTGQDHTSSNEITSSDKKKASMEEPFETVEVAPAAVFSDTSNDPANSKYRVVISAQRLVTHDDGVQTEVMLKWYPFEGAPNAKKVRITRVFKTSNDHGAEQTIGIYAHAADVGSVVERKSNISRLFGKFDSPSEKLLLHVAGAHNHVLGQEANVLTPQGIKRFLTVPKMLDAPPEYGAWVLSTLLPAMEGASTFTAMPARSLAPAVTPASRVSGRKRSVRATNQDDNGSYTCEAKRKKRRQSVSFV
jgi:hypothetical protein